MLQFMLGILYFLFLLAFVDGSAIPDSAGAVLAPRATATFPIAAPKMAAYWSAFQYPNVVPKPETGSGDTSTLKVVYLFAVNVTLDDMNFNFASTFNGGPAGKVDTFAYDQTILQGGKKPPEWNSKADCTSAAGNTNVKCIPCFGGWGMDAGFKTFARDSTHQQAFAKAAVAWVVGKGFDGLDLDWEYPGAQDAAHGSTPELYAELCAAIRAEIKTHNDDDATNNGSKYQLTLSIALPSNGGTPGTDGTDLDRTISSGSIAKFTDSVDWFNVMTYDFYNGNSAQAGSHTGKGVILNTLGRLAKADGDFKVDPARLTFGTAAYARQWPIKSTCTNGAANSPVPSCDVVALTADQQTLMGDPSVTGPVPFNIWSAVVNSGWDTTGRWKAVWKNWQGVLDKAIYTGDDDGAHYYFDATVDDAAPHGRAWSWTNGDDVTKACKAAFTTYSTLGGVFVFSMGEDAIDPSYIGTGGDDSSAMSVGANQQSKMTKSETFSGVAACLAG